jgi:hypothetical protein
MDQLRGENGPRPRPTRRRWLQGVAYGCCVAAAGGLAALARTSGYEAPLEPLVALRGSEYVLVCHVARRMLAPDAEGAPSPDELGVGRYVDAYVARLTPRLRTDLVRMLRFTEHAAPLAAGYARRFTSLLGGDQDRVLAALESSSIDQLRGGFQAMKAVVMMGYYRDPRTFGVLQYGGPLLTATEDLGR